MIRPMYRIRSILLLLLIDLSLAAAVDAIDLSLLSSVLSVNQYYCVACQSEGATIIRMTGLGYDYYYFNNNKMNCTS
jgi:hypothetical protein